MLLFQLNPTYVFNKWLQKHLPCNANEPPTNVNNQGCFKKLLYNYIRCYKYTSDLYSIVYMFVLDKGMYMSLFCVLDNGMYMSLFCVLDSLLVQWYAPAKKKSRKPSITRKNLENPAGG